VGDLGTALSLHRDPQQRLALTIGERGHAGQRLAHHGAPLVVGFDGVGRVQRFLELVVVVSASLEGVERGVVRDPVQPRLEVLDLGASLTERRASLDEGLLSASSLRDSGSIRRR